MCFTYGMCDGEKLGFGAMRVVGDDWKFCACKAEAVKYSRNNFRSTGIELSKTYKTLNFEMP